MRGLPGRPGSPSSFSGKEEPCLEQGIGAHLGATTRDSEATFRSGVSGRSDLSITIARGAICHWLATPRSRGSRAGAGARQRGRTARGRWPSPSIRADRSLTDGSGLSRDLPAWSPPALARRHRSGHRAPSGAGVRRSLASPLHTRMRYSERTGAAARKEAESIRAPIDTTKPDSPNRPRRRAGGRAPTLQTERQESRMRRTVELPRGGLRSAVAGRLRTPGGLPWSAGLTGWDLQ